MFTAAPLVTCSASAVADTTPQNNSKAGGIRRVVSNEEAKANGKAAKAKAKANAALAAAEKAAAKATAAATKATEVAEKKKASEALKLSEVFKKLEVQTIDGAKVAVPTFWKSRPVVLYFIRRFGCIVCRHNATILSRCKTALDAIGVRFIAVAPERDGMEEFIEQGYFKGEVYADPNRVCYKALKLKRATLLGILSKRVRKVISRATNAGIKGNMKGDFRQLGGLFVIAPDGDKGHCKVLLEFRDAFFGDAVDTEFMLKTLGVGRESIGYNEATERFDEDLEDANVPDSAMADDNECVACLRTAMMEEEKALNADAEYDMQKVDKLIAAEEQKIQMALLSRAMEPVSLLDINEVLSRTVDMAPPKAPERLSLKKGTEEEEEPFEIPADLPPPSSFDCAPPTTQLQQPRRMPRGVVGCNDDACTQ